MTTLLITHKAGFDHLVPLGHPERPDRLRALEQVLAEDRFAALKREEAPLGTADHAKLAHPADFVDAIEHASPAEGLVSLDGDTTMSPGSWEAAMRAIGGTIDAVEKVVAREINNAFVCMRPPGHHAESRRAMGFCLFNQIAIGAIYAREKLGLERVAVVDFDVHHGNGTQEIFWNDRNLFYASTHQMPLYPGTGAKGETGVGNIFNAPMSPGAGGESFREAFESRILPALENFKPDLLMISAGFDAHRRDPLANINLVEDDFAWATQKLMDIADTSSGGRLVSVLEGGYDLVGLSQSAAAHVEKLMQA